ncbi:hypothetical protein V5O48_008280 [Marasmius crinis-equi]|uniref:Uncharacterized protein n=1 Tax=Marasmius crinis-equi TaxID=585013 RepID=A0ABR3FEJ8_9AGAR
MPSLGPIKYFRNHAYRVALSLQALTALKHKPPGQSCASYVLDLQGNFLPSVTAATGWPGDQPTARSEKGPHDAGEDEQPQNFRGQVVRWRDRALRLEQELGELRVKYEAEQIKTISLARVAEAQISESVQTAQAPRIIDCQDPSPLISTTSGSRTEHSANAKASSVGSSGPVSASASAPAAATKISAATTAGKKKATKKKQQSSALSNSKESNPRDAPTSDAPLNLEALLEEHFNGKWILS